MEVKKQVEIKSAKVAWLLKLKSKSEQPLINASIIRLGNLYKRARSQEVYAYLAFMPILEEMTYAKKFLVTAIERFEKVIHLQKLNLDSIHISVKTVYEFRIGNPVVELWIELLELSDQLNCLLSIVHHFNLAKEGRSHFFYAVSKNQKRLNKIMNSILHIREKAIPSVHITDYLGQTEAYREAVKSAGEITPEQLFSAIHLERMPRFESKVRNQIIYKLKAKKR